MSPVAINSGLQAAISAASSRFQALDVVSNNLANANTTGFKRDIPCFDAVLDEASAALPLSAIRLRETVPDQRPGILRQTGNPYDLAIEGDGYLEIMTAEGVRYTRQGNLQLNPEGQLITASGDPVLAGGSPVKIPAGEYELLEDGTISVAGTTIARLTLSTFPAEEKPRKAGNGLFLPPGQGSMQPVDSPRFAQGSLENSNVSTLEEMGRMITYQREFETLQKLIKTYNTLAGKADELGSF